nr:hypothetical protein [Tanacetum cinerariifolium]
MLKGVKSNQSNFGAAAGEACIRLDCSCSKGSVEDTILVPKPLKNCARCVRCGHPVNGPYCQGCTLLREKLEEDLVTYFPNFQNTSESSDGSTNVVNAPREPFVVKQDHGVNPPHIDECCCECGEALDGIICQRCACKTYGKDAHIGYNCPPKVPIISNPEPCNQTMNNEPPQTLPSFDSTCYSDKEISVPCVSKPNFVDESSNIFNPPPQLPIYSCEFCGSNAQYGHYCTPQAPFINPKLGYSQDFNFPHDFYDFQQQYLCCDQCGGPHETFQCQQFPVVHPPPQETSIEISHDQENVINSVQTFLRKFNRYSFFKTPKVLLLAWDRVSEIKDAFENEQYKPKDIQQLFRKLLDDLQNIHEELAEFINSLSWNPKDHFEIVINSNDDYSSSDDDSLYYENIEYVEASPHDSKLVGLEVEKIVLLKDEEIEDDNLHENYNPFPSFEFLTKSSSTSPTPFLEGTNTFHNSLPEFKKFCFDLEEISSGSTTTHSDISLPEYEAFSFYDDHIEEISSGSTTTQSDISLPEYDSFIFDISNDQFPPSDGSDFTHKEFGDESAHIICPPEYDCFYFRNLPDPGELISNLNSEIRENLSSTTCVNLPVEDDHSLFWRMLYGSFLLITRISLFLLIFTHSEMKIPSLTQASPLIVFIRLSQVYLIGVELLRNSILTVVT